MERIWLTYEEATQAYLAQFHALLEAPAEGTAARRGSDVVPVEVLVARADQIVDLSVQMLPLSKPYLTTEDPAAREGISAQLIAQATAELHLASELLETASAGGAGQGPAGLRRSAAATGLRDAVRALELALAPPVPQGLAPAVPRARAGAEPTTVEAARHALEQAASQALDTIAQHVRELGGDIAFDLITATKWAAVVEGAGLLRQDIATKLEAIKEGIGVFFGRVLRTVTKILLNVYDKVLTLLGRDLEGRARTRIQEWLTQIEAGQNVELFEELIDKLYQIGAYKKTLPGRLVASTASVATLNQTSTAVAAVAAKFVVLSGRLRMLQSAANLAKLLSIPEVLVGVACIQVALLAVDVYAGYDYIGHGQGRLLDLATGVAQVIEEHLGSAVEG